MCFPLDTRSLGSFIRTLKGISFGLAAQGANLGAIALQLCYLSQVASSVWFLHLRTDGTAVPISPGCCERARGRRFAPCPVETFSAGTRDAIHGLPLPFTVLGGAVGFVFHFERTWVSVCVMDSLTHGSMWILVSEKPPAHSVGRGTVPRPVPCVPLPIWWPRCTWHRARRC